jgi:hypothetical protein
MTVYQSVNTATTGATVRGMANTGVSIISVTTADTFTLQPPYAGAQKRIVCTSATTTIQPRVRGSTAQTVTFDAAGNTMFLIKPAASSHHVVVDLVGLSSVAWAIVNVYPCLTTGLGHGCITLSTT